MSGYNVLIIEDDADIRESVRIILESEGFHVDEAETGREGIDKINADTGIVLLDVMLPDISGYAVCEEIRRKSLVPILYLTAKSSENDKVIGFAAGGDDYLVKPFSYVELISRIKALLRRNNEYNIIEKHATSQASKWIEYENIRINFNKNEVFISGTEIELTETEYGILLLLIQNPDRVISVQELYEKVWGEDFRNEFSNTVMVYIRKLRKKIESDPQKPKIVLTVWGKGYRIG